MALMRTANPALNANTFEGTQVDSGDQVMTLQGTVNKTGFLFFLLVLASGWTWSQARLNPAAVGQWMWVWLLVGFIIGLVTVFKKAWAPVTAPVYAIAEGLVLGGISAFFEMQYPGIVIQAVALTFGTLGALLIV